MEKKNQWNTGYWIVALLLKKGTVLNSDISSVISRLGHTDTLVVCDAGLPIPKSTTRIDMALTQGVPSFMQVLGVVTNEMQVEVM